MADESSSFRIDYRVLTVAALLLAVGALSALVATSSSSGLEQTALVLAVVAFGADLIIALASYMIASQSESRVNATNAATRETLARIDEQANEIRNLTRLNTRDLLEMASGRVLENAPLGDRATYQRALGEVLEEVKETPLLQPPAGGRRGRQERLKEALTDWVDRQGFQRVPNPSGWDDGAERFEANGVLYIVEAVAGRFEGFDHDMKVGKYVHALREDWPDKEVRTAAVIEPPELSMWRASEGPVRVVTIDNLDDILLGPLQYDKATDSYV